MRSKDEHLLNLIGQQAAQHAAEKANLLLEIERRQEELVMIRAELDTTKKALTEKV